MGAYFVLFAIVHSFLADPRFKSRARKALGKAFDRWQRLAYNLLALLMMLPFLFIMIFLPDRILYIVPAPWSWLMVSQPSSWLLLRCCRRFAGRASPISWACPNCGARVGQQAERAGW